MSYSWHPKPEYTICLSHLFESIGSTDLIYFTLLDSPDKLDAVRCFWLFDHCLVNVLIFKMCNEYITVYWPAHDSASSNTTQAENVYRDTNCVSSLHWYIKYLITVVYSHFPAHASASNNTTQAQNVYQVTNYISSLLWETTHLIAVVYSHFPAHASSITTQAQNVY